MVKGTQAKKEKEHCRHIDEMIEFGGEIGEFVESKGFEQAGLQVAVRLHQGFGIKVEAGEVSDEGEQIPAHHQQTKNLEISPTPTGERGAANIPEKIAQGEDVV